MLEVKHISKTYGSGKNAFPALFDVNINFGSKGLVIILGKSGCGKSTLLNIIGGMDTPTEGEVIINGRSTKNFRRSEYDEYRNTFVGIVFQEFNLIDDISVFDNINMTMKLQEKNTDVNTVDEALAMVGLQNLGYRKPSELSGGQRQRVSLARALLKKPEIVLADEPTGALDSATGEEVFETLKKIALDKLVIVVTHNRDLANTYGDRIIEISDGRIVSDKTRAVDEGSDVKELPGGVIEVASTGELNADILNKKLVKGKTNYIGLSHDKDRIALAYPETVDSFYEQADAAAFNETTDEDIPKDEKEFRLSKGGLTLKESIKLARGNIKRHKKRFRFINVIATWCFVFVALGLMVGMANVNNIIAETAFDTDAAFVETTAVSEGNYYDEKAKKLDAEQIENIKSVAGGTVGYGTKLFSTPELAKSEDNVPSESTYEAYSYAEQPWNIKYDFSYFNGVIEVNDVSDIGMTIAAGETKCNNVNEIIISDFAAYMLGKKGFIGTDKDGKMDVQYLPDVESMVGYSINIRQTKKLYKVVGVFKTDFRKYASVASGKADDDLVSEFRSLFGYEYRKIIGCTGLASTLASDSSSSYSANLEWEDRGYRCSIDPDYFTFDRSVFAVNEDDWEKPRLVWAKEKRGNDYVIPEALGPNEMILPLDMVRSIADAYEISDDATLIASQKFSNAVNKQYNISFSTGWNGGTLTSVENMKIVGVVRAGSDALMFDKSVTDKVMEASSGYDILYFERGSTASSLESKVKDLREQKFAVGSAMAGASMMNEFASILNTLSSVFFYVALGMFVFAFLIIFNYISTSVRFRTKEIAVYRVIGAKSRDISKMFLAEGGGIVIRTSIAAIIISFLVSLFLDWMLGTAMSSFGIGFSIIRFNWLLEPLAIILGSAITVLVSSFIPVFRVTRKRPVEAVKMI